MKSSEQLTRVMIWFLVYEKLVRTLNHTWEVIHKWSYFDTFVWANKYGASCRVVACKGRLFRAIYRAVEYSYLVALNNHCVLVIEQSGLLLILNSAYVFLYFAAHNHDLDNRQRESDKIVQFAYLPLASILRDSSVTGSANTPCVEEQWLVPILYD